jgi:hypothetical protein
MASDAWGLATWCRLVMPLLCITNLTIILLVRQESEVLAVEAV